MKNTLSLPLALLGALLGSPALAQVGINIQLGQPNYYGGLNIQGFPNPQLYNSRPILTQPYPFRGRESPPRTSSLVNP